MLTIGHTGVGSCICAARYSNGAIVVDPRCTVASHSQPVDSVAFSPDGKHIVSGAADKLVKIWDADTGAEVNSDGFREGLLNTWIPKLQPQNLHLYTLTENVKGVGDGFACAVSQEV